MSGSIPTRVRQLAFLGVVALFLVYRGAAPSAVIGWCDNAETCGPDVSCDEPCLIGDPAEETTCGEYGGTPVDPVRGNCLGYCGNGYCNDFASEDVESCYDDCGECGDSICTPSPEEWVGSFCCQDCGTCGGTYATCDDSFDCGEGLGCNDHFACCTSIIVSGCGFCDTFEDCEDWPGQPSGQKICVTKGADCSGQA